jgi:predicted AAA+ superfamily ATPase
VKFDIIDQIEEIEVPAVCLPGPRQVGKTTLAAGRLVLDIFLDNLPISR